MTAASAASLELPDEQRPIERARATGVLGHRRGSLHTAYAKRADDRLSRRRHAANGGTTLAPPRENPAIADAFFPFQIY
ncbi:hypothetical protein BAU08_25575 [Bordetella bronchialis]|uniref:Uncharacterized protein n=1 Tax=Bordetella bronchialis TaxID=463025 RepID=A0A193G4Z1_9BORD|nr:hypothetical protein BAU08_25575 [Bordetella bronchialis]